MFQTGVLQLLQTRTSRRFLQSRLTPDMERKLVFFTSNVRFGNHKRYQEWFQKQVTFFKFRVTAMIRNLDRLWVLFC